MTCLSFSCARSRMRLAISRDGTAEPPGELTMMATVLPGISKARWRSGAAICMLLWLGCWLAVLTPCRRTTGITGPLRRITRAGGRARGRWPRTRAGTVAGWGGQGARGQQGQGRARALDAADE